MVETFAELVFALLAAVTAPVTVFARGLVSLFWG